MAKLYIHPLPIRIWHWLNALGIILLILTGLQIRYAGLFDLMSFRNAVRLHNWTGFFVAANFLLWFLYYVFSDRIKVYLPELNPRKYFPAMFRQVYYYAYGILRGEPNPYRVTVYGKFNPMQAMTYQVVMLVLLPLQFFTGLLLWDVTGFSNQIDMLGGIRIVSTVHMLLSIAFVAFLLPHLYLVTLGHTFGAHTKGMITGYEDVDDEPANAPAAATAPASHEH